MGIVSPGEPDQPAGRAGAAAAAGTKVCPGCGAEYLGWVVRCTTCGVALLEASGLQPQADVPAGDVSVLDLPEDEQLVYELGGYSLVQRTELAAMLAEAGIAHAWEATDLIVRVADEETVDALCAQVEQEQLIDPEVLAARAEALLDPSADAVSFQLDEWEPDEREALGAALSRAGIAHLWDAETLIVATSDSDAAEAVMDRIEFPDALAPEGPEEGEVRAELLGELFLAADRLMNHPLDPDGLEGLSAALDETDPSRPPYGVAPDLWAAVVEDAEALFDLLTEDDPDEAGAVELAGAIRARLRNLV